MADAHGFPELDSNIVYGENFDPTLAVNQGIAVTDANAFPSPLVIKSTTPFNLGARFIDNGILAAILQGLTGAIAAQATTTTNYFAEPLTSPPGGGPIALGSVTKQTNAGVPDLANPAHIVYDENLMKLSLSAGALGVGTYRLTATHTFSGILQGLLPFSSYVTGPVIEIFS